MRINMFIFLLIAAVVIIECIATAIAFFNLNY